MGNVIQVKKKEVLYAIIIEGEIMCDHYGKEKKRKSAIILPNNLCCFLLLLFMPKDNLSPQHFGQFTVGAVFFSLFPHMKNVRAQLLCCVPQLDSQTPGN